MGLLSVYLINRKISGDTEEPESYFLIGNSAQFRFAQAHKAFLGDILGADASHDPGKESAQSRVLFEKYPVDPVVFQVHSRSYYVKQAGMEKVTTLLDLHLEKEQAEARTLCASIRLPDRSLCLMLIYRC
jgi:hypothetical protein